MSEMKDGNNVSASLLEYDGKLEEKNKKKKQLSMKPGCPERKKESLQLDNSICNQQPNCTCNQVISSTL